MFNNIENQKLFSKKVNIDKRGGSIKKAWDERRFRRDHSKCGVRGDLHPSKRLEVKKLISEWQLSREPEYCAKCKKWFKNLAVHLYRSKIHNA